MRCDVTVTSHLAPKRYLYRSFDLFSILDFSYSSENLATMTVTGRARTMSPAKRASVPNTIPREDSGNMSPYLGVERVRKGSRRWIEGGEG